jgi:hypothetical protein
LVLVPPLKRAVFAFEDFAAVARAAEVFEFWFVRSGLCDECGEVFELFVRASEIVPVGLL